MFVQKRARQGFETQSAVLPISLWIEPSPKYVIEIILARIENFVEPMKAQTVRLSRLPQCERGETGQMQELFYLNPHPKAKPLLDQTINFC